MDAAVLDDIIDRLLEYRQVRVGKQVQLMETEIRQLCSVSREIFLRQSNLVEIEAPIKICGGADEVVMRVFGVVTYQIRNLPRPTDVPDSGLLCDLLWSDPSRDVKGWGMNDRGVSYTFGPDKVSEFLKKNDMDLVCRAHQVVEEGYEFFAERQLVTIFSAPNYCGEFDNAGAMMSVDETLMCSFQILKPGDKKPNFI
ncbi:hypothetical protein FH972_011644 [Carpinus fangiana]|uniref:protein-serine/threonine phosphatase n=1 Tax=Carpinus fangiana TaxID=176857 RepID=A0A660KV20_9ROSI|nr:hypothetical protein FH972_011644 [Carpinus fangiana]